ncbi:alkaline phosphatase D family protein [Saccharopolyspora erythraea]|uniref:alkaline phosphatase D family protein n=1 Tax=Saccharopolyspora erythraea TaxID=1836 RepID=UPI00038D8697|nr:alkaline phosphatase D family protein [Saccharopolyspora erythraea]EQD86686.1 alkaline phosphatase [Saccharopolyspora erythraea D]QRK89430.1 alkaline phosphatase D family protein [Saccharopolyspora erythraea]
MSDPTNPGPRRAVSRRAVLLGGAAALGASTLGGTSLASALSSPGAGLGRRIADPFTLGVASGDPLADGVVLWTRLAPEPTAEDGTGGMPDKVVEVQWEVAEDEAFSRIVQSGEQDAAPDLGHSVHVELEGLKPGAEYFYRFRAEGSISPVGRTRTAPAPGTMGELTMCFASCAHFGEGYFTAYRRMAEDEPGLILHLGDYQYEYAAKDSDVRKVLGPETRTLANYRQRHGQYKTDPDLQLAHSVAPWLVVWDDHEIENNWADETPEKPDDGFLDRRKAAMQAYYENMPLRSGSKPNGIDTQLYRRYQWGALANFHMLDTRQYRSDQACGDGVQSGCSDREDPNRSLTGAEQEKWLIDGFNATSARWDVLGQQVFFSKIDLTFGAEKGYNMDAWDGYVANRDRIAGAMAGSKVRNGVVLTGDVHRHWAAEIKRTHDDADSPAVGTEFVTTSVTSGGDGNDDGNEDVLGENPHVKFYANRRGYIRTKFTETQLRADYRVLGQVSKPDAAAETAKSFVVEDGNPTLNPA